MVAGPPRVLVAFGRFVFRYRDALGPLLLAVVVLGTKPHAFADERLNLAFSIAGWLLALAGQTLRILVIGLAYIQRGGRDRAIAADRLVTDGVFAHSRNPLYVGNFLMLCGLTLLWNSPIVDVVVPAIAAVTFVSITLAEEVFLEERFGDDYRAYARRVNRFLPDPRGFASTWKQFSFDGRRVVRKEYGTTFALLSTGLTVTMLARIDRLGLERSIPSLRAVALVWLIGFMGWATARRLKKRGELGRG